MRLSITIGEMRRSATAMRAAAVTPLSGGRLRFEVMHFVDADADLAIGAGSTLSGAAVPITLGILARALEKLALQARRPRLRDAIL